MTQELDRNQCTHERPQKLFQGGNVDIFFIIFKLRTISVPSKIILHSENIFFIEHDYFRNEWVEFSMNYKFCELYYKYIILSKYEQNTHFIQISSCLPAVPLLWNVASAREWDFTAQQFWWSWAFAPLRGNIADEWRCKWTFTKRLILSALQRKCPVLR